jgi:hypothetical protein
MKMQHISTTLLLTLLLATPVLADAAQETAPASAQTQQAVQGKVLETMSGAGYTYLLIENGTKKTWAAIPESKIEVGQEVAVQPGMVMKSFESKALGKTFEEIIFSPGLATGADGSQDPEMDAPLDDEALAALSGGSSRAIVPANDDLKIDKAEGENGRTVEQCFTEADQLNGKTVRVRGKVVKFTPQIMGKNWIHLQDGSGDPMKNTHDLVVTTTETAARDAVVLVEGVLSKDKDFGAGYRYDAIIEDAKIVK